jgi:hypothetical protein
MQDVSGHGQLYVAATSRAIASSRIKFFIAENPEDPDGRSVRNLVFRQALLFNS